MNINTVVPSRVVRPAVVGVVVVQSARVRRREPAVQHGPALAVQPAGKKRARKKLTRVNTRYAFT